MYARSSLPASVDWINRSRRYRLRIHPMLFAHALMRDTPLHSTRGSIVFPWLSGMHTLYVKSKFVFQCIRNHRICSAPSQHDGCRIVLWNHPNNNVSVRRVYHFNHHDWACHYQTVLLKKAAASERSVNNFGAVILLNEVWYSTIHWSNIAATRVCRALHNRLMISGTCDVTRIYKIDQMWRKNCRNWSNNQKAIRGNYYCGNLCATLFIG